MRIVHWCVSRLAGDDSIVLRRKNRSISTFTVCGTYDEYSSYHYPLIARKLNTTAIRKPVFLNDLFRVMSSMWPLTLRMIVHRLPDDGEHNFVVPAAMRIGPKDGYTAAR